MGIHPDAGGDFHLAFHQLQQPRLPQRADVLLQVAGAIALVRVGGVLPLPPLDDVPRPLEYRLDAAGPVAAGGPSAVIEMQVAHDDGIDVVGREPRLAERAADVAIVLDSVNVFQLGRELSPLPSLDEDPPPASLDEQAGGAVLAPVQAVARHQLGPERLRNDAVHGAAVEPKVATVEAGEARVPEGQHAAIVPLFFAAVFCRCFLPLFWRSGIYGVALAEGAGGSETVGAVGGSHGAASTGAAGAGSDGANGTAGAVGTGVGAASAGAATPTGSDGPAAGPVATAAPAAWSSLSSDPGLNGCETTQSATRATSPNRVSFPSLPRKDM